MILRARVWLGMGLFVVAGCSKPAERLNAPPQGASNSPSDSQEFFVYMTDNAMLADAVIVDEHFIPHTDEISPLGARRLERYAQLMETYRFALNYDTDLDDEELVAARIAHVKEYLAVSGLEPSRIEVERGAAGERGMSAQEAMKVREGSMYKERKKGGGGLGGLLGGGS